MRRFTFWTLVLLSSCSTKKEVTQENKESSDTITTIQEGLPQAETKINEIIRIDFSLDSLLKFDSETELKNVFGDKIKRSTGYYPEGMGEYQNTLLFPGTKNEVEFVWLDDSITFSGLAYINLSGQGTDWKTREGITLGTKLKELEKLNQKPFTFYGFGWDYSGMTNWDEGHLYDRKVFVNLGYPSETIPPEYEGLFGDQEMRSDSELAQKANPVVCVITMRR
jgi:hypothetical protein